MYLLNQFYFLQHPQFVVKTNEFIRQITNVTGILFNMDFFRNSVLLFYFPFEVSFHILLTYVEKTRKLFYRILKLFT